MKEIWSDADFADELAILKQYAGLVDKFDEKKKEIKNLQSEINDSLMIRYKNLNDEEIKMLANSKWEVYLSDGFGSDRTRSAKRLSEHISTLWKRYDQTLPKLIERAKALDSQVREGLAVMNLEW